MSARRAALPLAGIGLALVAFLAPFSATRLVGSMTLGRTVAVFFAVLLAIDIARARPRPVALGRATILAGSAYLGLFGWVLVSSIAWGCNCDGKLGGLAEFSFIGVLALVAVFLEPRLRRIAMGATLAGLALAAVLALSGAGSINSGTVDLTQTGGRLAGTFGNANELGFALALGLPIGLAYLPVTRGGQRIALGALASVLAVALILTFSRGGIVAAGVGTVAVGLWLARGNRRRIKAIVGATAAAILVAAVLYSTFERGRREVSFPSVSPTLQPLDQRDLSGWDSRRGGPIPAGPSQLRDRPEGFAVRGERGGEGVSYRWGEAARGGRYELSFRARAAGPRPVPVSFALGDGVRGVGPEGRATLGPRPRTFQLAWQPRRRAPHATLYVWQRAQGPATFVLSDVGVRARTPGREQRIIAVPDQLRGSIYARLVTAAEREEDRYFRSRLDAAELALDAFASEPLRGIGWSAFPDYADGRLDYGRLAVHDEYLSVAAELGIVGLALLGLLGAGIVGGIRRAGEGATEAAAIGALAAAAAGLLFVEALPIPQLSIPVALAIAVVCAGRGAASRI